jgi:hypothetical protein
MDFFLNVLGIIAISIWLYFLKDENLRPELIGIRFGIALSLGTIALKWLWENRADLKIWVQSLNPFVPKQCLRLSIAYLYRIHINGKYLLIRNGRDQNHAFQPVGGVYKYFPGENRDGFERLGIIPDSNMENDDRSEADLRLHLKHRRKLPAFLKWFGKGTNREADPWREFYEELVRPGILPNGVFPYVQYKHLGAHRTGIQFSEKFNKCELLLADIFELLPNKEQKEALLKLQREGHSDIIWAKEDEIQLGRQNGNIILPHAKKLFDYQTIN